MGTCRLARLMAIEAWKRDVLNAPEDCLHGDLYSAFCLDEEWEVGVLGHLNSLLE